MQQLQAGRSSFSAVVKLSLFSYCTFPCSGCSATVERASQDQAVAFRIQAVAHFEFVFAVAFSGRSGSNFDIRRRRRSLPDLLPLFRVLAELDSVFIQHRALL